MWDWELFHICPVWILGRKNNRVNPKKVVLDYQSSMDLLWKRSNSASPSHRALKSRAPIPWAWGMCLGLWGGWRLAMKVGKGDGYQAFTYFLALVARPICNRGWCMVSCLCFFLTHLFSPASLFLLCFSLSFPLSVPSPHPRDVVLTLQN